MNKAELVKTLSKHANLTLAEADAFVNAFIGTVTHALAKKDRVNLMGYGAWKVTTRKARTGINPLTKKPLSIPAKQVVRFGASLILKALINH